jgi:DNA-binding beta-propeller fold protein YncE
MASAVCLSLAGEAQPTESPLALETKILLGEVRGRIDHLAIDLRRQRLFIAELGNDSMSAVDLAAGQVQSRVTGMSEPQGIGYEASTDAVYVANGGDGSLRILRGNDLTPLTRIELGTDADNLRIDPLRRHVLVGYGSGGLAVIDAVGRAKIADIPLKGHPESFQIAGDGVRAFVNVPDAGLIELVDLIKGESIGTLPTRGHRGNFPMAFDNGARQLATVFRQPARLVVTDTSDQKLLADLETCGDADDVFFDVKRRRLYVVCGEGLIDVFAAGGAGFVRTGQVQTASGARTGMFVPELDRLFVAARTGWTDPAGLLVFRPID